MQINTSYEGIATPIVIEGQVVKENLKSLGLDAAWLESELSKRQLASVENVLLALLDTDGSLYLAEQPPLNVIKAFFWEKEKTNFRELRERTHKNMLVFCCHIAYDVL